MTLSAPLAGVRVLDLTRLLPGPMCTLYLADLGADVIKVEDTGAGDYARTVALSAPPVEGGATAWYRDAQSQQALALRSTSSTRAGHAAFMALARKADVIVEGFRPGVVASLGVGYEAVHAVNPSVVYCALVGLWTDRAAREGTPATTSITWATRAC